MDRLKGLIASPHFLMILSTSVNSCNVALASCSDWLQPIRIPLELWTKKPGTI